MRLPIMIVALIFAATCPAAAQLHEQGVARTGAVQKTMTGNTAFLCRIACSVEAGCTGWTWTRAGADGPQARCELLTGPLQSRADTCCESGFNGEVLTPAAPPSAEIVSRGDRYATRSQQPFGPPVQLTGDVTGGIWTDGTTDEDEEETDTAGAEDQAEDGEEETLSAEEEDDARFDAAQQADAPVTMTPSARITSAPLRREDAPAYSVQREYGAAAPATSVPGELRSERLP